ncbi:hypothetical protein P3S67_012176 [Capsicum chacoense]
MTTWEGIEDLTSHCINWMGFTDAESVFPCGVSYLQEFDGCRCYAEEFCYYLEGKTTCIHKWSYAHKLVKLHTLGFQFCT